MPLFSALDSSLRHFQIVVCIFRNTGLYLVCFLIKSGLYLVCNTDFLFNRLQLSSLHLSMFKVHRDWVKYFYQQLQINESISSTSSDENPLISVSWLLVSISSLEIGSLHFSCSGISLIIPVLRSHTGTPQRSVDSKMKFWP